MRARLGAWNASTARRVECEHGTTYAVAVNGERERPEFLRRADLIAPWVLDALLVLPVLAVMLATASHGLQRGSNDTHIVTVASASVLSTLPLVVRRLWPIQVFGATVIFGVAIPSAAPREKAVASAIIAAFAFYVHRLAWGYNLPLFEVVAGIALAGLVLALGLYQSTRLAYFDQVRERAARLERERTLLDEQAATDERLRIARELHDVVAHNVSLMVIQAQALGAVADDPAAARRGADTIAELGRDAMNEMHRTLALMRPDRADDERSPQPALDDLGPLLDRAHSAGVVVELSVTGTARPLPAGVELSAYRIVQEALTNVIKHSGSDRASVSLRYGGDRLELEIVDEGGGGLGHIVPSSGHGLVGMRERVALFGGSLDAGPVEDRGYRVLATLPYDR
jgi:signal transduction histidine kinase